MNIKCPHCGTEYDIEQREFGKYVTCQVCGKGFVAGALQTREQTARPDAGSFGAVDIPPESACLKAWVKYWLVRLVVVCVLSFIFGLVCGFVEGLTGSIPFHEWPKEGVHRLAHIAVYIVVVLGVYLTWRLSWSGYKRCAVCHLFPDNSARNVFASWLVPIIVNTILSLLMPMSLQIAILGVYGYIVWCFTIWIVVDYFLFRFMSVNLLCGQKVDTRWISPAILFCIFIVLMYGFARVVENGGVRHSDMLQIYDRMKQMDDSRHHDASQIYDRMGRMKLY